MKRKQIIDQGSHLSAAILVLVPLVMAPGLLSGAWAGFWLGYVREITEEGAVVTLASIKAAFGSKLDLIFWTAGGALSGLLFYTL